jgi:predicted metalloprotease with PDZ domain
VNKKLLGALALLPVGAAGPWNAAPLSAQTLADIRYDVVFNAETALRREIHVEMSFEVATDSPVALSLPSWTPGAYELDDHAKNVRGLWARQDGNEIRWDKADFDTWQVYPTGQGQVTVGFDYLADALDTGNAWSKPDFTFFNGTNVFFFPDGGDPSFESIVTFHTETDWKVTTGLTALSTSEYVARDYHELVDMPTFVGRFDLDSMRVDDRWHRLATYPEGVMAGAPRSQLWDEIRRMMPPMEAVFDDVPFDKYTTMLVFDPDFGGGSALEHSNSHLGIYHPTFLGSPILALITAHEIFHAWNVKRIRPADLWPYDYGRQMPTELLWISEGITDYYADLALVRGEIVSPEYFYQTTQGKIDEVRGVPPVALEDASLSAWIGPRDGTGGIYYPKGSLAGFMLDVLIRDASDNRHSLDDVLKAMYEDAYLQGRGFTEEQWWAAVREAAGGRSFQDFHDAYVDGREPYPWSQILPLAGLRLEIDIERVARMGIVTNQDAQGVVVVDVEASGAAGSAGVAIGDHLVSVGGIVVEDGGFGAAFRAAYGGRETGTAYDIVVDRGGQRMTLQAVLQFAETTSSRLIEDATADPKARRIRNGILTGAVEG